MLELVDRPAIGAIGLARIVDGEIAYMQFAGDRAPGEPADASTWFNTASVAKTVMAETVLRMAAKGLVGLDEPLSDHYVHPHLADDPRHRLLTPRIVLSHQTGLRNWPSSYDDGRLAFDRDPGSGVIGYSGAGMEMLAAFLEAKFDATYPELVDRHLFGPLGITGMAIQRTEAVAPLARGVDDEGMWLPAFLRTADGDIIPPGEYSAADNLYATVPGYVRFLLATARADGLDPAWAAERTRLLSRGVEPGYMCEEDVICPDPIGYGLGWTLLGIDGITTVTHSGNDIAEHAQVWFEPQTGDGVVMFVTGKDAFRPALRLLRTVDPDAIVVRYYDDLFAKHFPDQPQ